MTSEKKTLLGVAAYIAAAVLTFGHSAAHSCERYKTNPVFPECSEKATVDGVMAGMFWPLYWSWEVFEK